MLAILLSVVTIIILYFIIKNIMLWLTWHKYSPVDVVDLEMTYPNTFTKFQNSNFEIDSE